MPLQDGVTAFASVRAPLLPRKSVKVARSRLARAERNALRGSQRLTLLPVPSELPGIGRDCPATSVLSPGFSRVPGVTRTRSEVADADPTRGESGEVKVAGYVWRILYIGSTGGQVGGARLTPWWCQSARNEGAGPPVSPSGRPHCPGMGCGGCAWRNCAISRCASRIGRVLRAYWATPSSDTLSPCSKTAMACSCASSWCAK